MRILMHKALLLLLFWSIAAFGMISAASGLRRSKPKSGAKPVWSGSASSELHDLPEAILQCRHLFRRDYAQSTTQAFLCHRSDLVTHRHCGVPIAGNRDQDRRAG